MILTKTKLIEMLLADFKFGNKAVNNCIEKYRKYPEMEFYKIVKKDLKFTLEPIRKNTYIINI